MKNFLEYYYNLVNITIHEKNGYYYFDNNNKRYVFVYTIRNINEINAIYNLQDNLPKYHKIIPNRNNSPITLLNNRPFVLLELNSNSIIGKLDYKDFNKNGIILNREYSPLLRNDWIGLIEKKIDYIEYQRKHLNNRYKILDSSVDYYLGLAENAISYINNYILTVKKNNMDSLVVSHRRITEDSHLSFYNPLNIIIDHPSRDISGYLKELFISNTYDRNTIIEILNSINLSNYGYGLLYGRMIYPSFYFDMYEKIINEKEKEDNILKIIKRHKEYENYLNTIYRIISQKTKIPSIDWI